MPPANPQFERGKPYPVVDALGFIFSLPAKILLFNWSVESHDISPETEAALAEYLKENNLDLVKVRLNQYSPGDEWTRLTENKAVGAGWRYTVGVLNWLIYTILPGRVFGGDNFNTFSNTISIYSDHRAIVLHEGGHAKDDALTEYKGTYAVLRILPIVPLFQEAEASTDALSYYEDRKCRSEQKDAYKILYPAYATYIGGEVFRWVPGGLLLTAAVVIPGHVAGRVAAYNVEEADESHICDPKKPADDAASEPGSPNGTGSPKEAGTATPIPDPAATPAPTPQPVPSPVPLLVPDPNPGVEAGLDEADKEEPAAALQPISAKDSTPAPKFVSE